MCEVAVSAGDATLQRGQCIDWRVRKWILYEGSFSPQSCPELLFEAQRCFMAVRDVVGDESPMIVTVRRYEPGEFLLIEIEDLHERDLGSC